MNYYWYEVSPAICDAVNYVGQWDDSGQVHRRCWLQSVEIYLSASSSQEMDASYVSQSAETSLSASIETSRMNGLSH